MYGFSEFDYLDGLPQYHGWLPFYFIALYFKLLGISVFAARLPSVVFSMLSLLPYTNATEREGAGACSCQLASLVGCGVS